MRASYVFSGRSAIRLAVCVLAMGSVSLTRAADVVGANNQIWSAVSGNSAYMGMGRNGAVSTQGVGSPLPTSPLNLSGWQRAGNYGVSHDASGARFGATVKMPAGSGSIPVQVTARATGAAVAGAIVRTAARFVGPLAVGVAIYDLAKELGFTLDNASGSVSVQRQTSGEVWGVQAGSICDPAYDEFGVGIPGEGMQAYIDRVMVPHYGAVLEVYGAIHRRFYGGWYTFRVCRVEQSAAQPSTMQELEDAIASKSGWPTSSHVSRATVEAMQAGEEIKTDPPTVSGPATSSGPGKTSTAGDGKVTTTSVTNNHTYNDNRITTTTTTTTQVYNPATGATTTERVDEEPAKDPEKSECEKNPQTVGCAEADTPSGEAIPRNTVSVSYSAENPFGDGACPADAVANLGTLGQTVKVWDWQKTCQMALPLRAMVITLATFAAVFIVLPGGGARP